jgi:hypothetical protein
LARLIESLRLCFSARGFFETFAALVAGLVAAPARRSVCGMLTALGMSQRWHRSRAHRFFSSTRWSGDQLGLTLAGLLIGWLLPVGAPITVAVDDTLFRRRGRHVHAAVWAYDGSRQVTEGQTKLSRANTPSSWPRWWSRCPFWAARSRYRYFPGSGAPAGRPSPPWLAI